MAKILTLPHWDSNPRFLNKTFPPKIWILRKIRSIELTVLKKSRLYIVFTLKTESVIGNTIFGLRMIVKSGLSTKTYFEIPPCAKHFIFISEFDNFGKKSRFFKNRELYWSNLPQNSNLWRESFVQKSRVQIPAEEGKFFCHFSFFFTFFILSIKNWRLKHKLPFLYINRLHRNKIKFVQYTYFYWYLIGKRR